jgi:hypothetical protein
MESAERPMDLLTSRAIHGIVKDLRFFPPQVLEDHGAALRMTKKGAVSPKKLNKTSLSGLVGFINN